MQKIYAVGETLLDIIFKGVEPQTAKPGGSAFNTSVTLGRLGAPIHFISETGKDKVGDIILQFMEENGVASTYISRYSPGQTAVALAFLNDHKDAEYEFYKDYPSQRLSVEFPEFQKDDLLMFGSFYSLNPGIRHRVMDLLEKAKRAGVTILYDPNFRSSHAAERDKLIPLVRENLGYSTLVRASDEDLVNLFDTKNPDAAWKVLGAHTSVLVYTANAGGVHLRTPSLSFHMEVERIEPLSTIGAGDTFNAGLLYGLWKRGYRREMIQSLNQGQWEELIATAIQFSREVCLSYENYLPRAFVNHYKKSN
ncbi:MAG: carbohydrate kinase [Bacteroidales bacterium]|nr:carbohydrate kinase [Bacteroidales bacterium]